MITIIAPTDFSPIAENACAYAAHFAAEIKGTLLLFHVIRLPVSAASLPVTDELFDQAEVEKKLESLKNKLQTVTNSQIEIKTKNVLGFADHEINDLCNKIKPLAIVMSSHNSSFFRYFFQESTTVSTAQHQRCPVMVVAHNAVYKSFRKIAFATDLKDIYEIPVKEIETIVKLSNAELEIFYVAKNENAVNSQAINDLLLYHRLEQLKPQFAYVEDKNTLEGISRLTAEHSIDMLIILSKRHGLFHKSNTKEFVHHANLPVMVIHENDVAPNT